MNLKELKNKKRKFYLDVRSKVSSQTTNKINTEVLEFLKIKFLEKTNSGYIGIYWPLPGEIDLRNLKLTSKKKLALPVCINRNKVNYHYWGEGALEKDYSGIPGPINDKILSPKDLDILLVPALAVDLKGFRLGYGGGYFDLLRSNESWRKIPAFIIIPNACVSRNSLPRGEWDIPFNGWISEEGITQV